MGQAKLKKEEMKADSAYMDDILPIKLMLVLYAYHMAKAEPSDSLMCSGVAKKARIATADYISDQLEELNTYKQDKLWAKIARTCDRIQSYFARNEIDTHKGLITTTEWIHSLLAMDALVLSPDVEDAIVRSKEPLYKFKEKPEMTEQEMKDARAEQKRYISSARKHVKKIHAIAREDGFY